MSEYLIQSSTLNNIAKPIQTLTGSTNKISLEQMKTGVENANNEISIQAEKIAGILDMLDGKTAPTVPTVEQATPSISVSSSGLITATSTQTEGYVEGGTTSATKQLTTQALTTWTPTTKDQTIPSGTYLTGTQTIKGDNNLKAENIKSGVSIFDVVGTMTAGIGDTSAFCNFTVAKSGSFTLSEGTWYNSYTITHSLGAVPKLIILYNDTATLTQSTSVTQVVGYMAFRTTNDTTITTTTSSGVYLEAIWCDPHIFSGTKVSGYGGYMATPTISVGGDADVDSIETTFLSKENRYSLGSATATTITMNAYSDFCPGTYKWLMMA